MHCRIPLTASAKCEGRTYPLSRRDLETPAKTLVSSRIMPRTLHQHRAGQDFNDPSTRQCYFSSLLNFEQLSRHQHLSISPESVFLLFNLHLDPCFQPSYAAPHNIPQKLQTLVSCGEVGLLLPRLIIPRCISQMRICGDLVVVTQDDVGVALASSRRLLRH